MQVNYTIAEEPDAPSAEKGRMLFAGETTFVKGVVAMDGLPPPTGWKSALPGAPTSGSRR